MARGLWGAAFIWAIICHPLNAQIIPDGSTNTVVTLGQDGSVTVGIAPANRSGVSHNRYDRFDVNPPGARLDNRERAARTILNEVTSTRPTHIAGPVEVLGQRAHVIVANPNGIMLDGARFVNTGRVALTTGSISYHDQQIAPGVFQINPVATVEGGVIRLEAGGLSGQMDAVDLIAHEIRVGGPVENVSSNEASQLRLTAGRSRTEFDSSVVPGNVGAAWAQTRRSDGESGSGLIEITAGGVLRAHYIGIEVNGHGAGVRFAGEGYAGARGFSLRSDGEIELSSARIDTRGSAGLSGTNLRLSNSNISAAGDIAMQSTSELEFVESSLRAGGSAIAKAGDASFRNSSIQAGGHVLITSDDLSFGGADRQTEIIARNGSLILSSSGSIVNHGALLQGGLAYPDLRTPDGVAASGAVTIRAVGDISNIGQNHAATIFAAAGDVDVEAGGALANSQGRIIANGSVRLAAGDDIRNTFATDWRYAAASITNERTNGRRTLWSLGLKRERRQHIVYDFGAGAAPQFDTLITATQDVSLLAEGDIFNHGATISAHDGDITIRGNEFENITGAVGRVELTRRCGLFCRTTSSGDEVLTSGAAVQAGGNLSVEARGIARNIGGVLVGHDTVTIRADQLEAIALHLPVVVNRPRGMHSFWRSSSAWLATRQSAGWVIARNGDVVVETAQAARIEGDAVEAGGSVSLSSGREEVQAPDLPMIAPQPAGLLRWLPGL
ncbi:MAG: filamentous hemagglutinin N-terminal domain-containing protein [Paracoccus sp. (in: a-proteobacteria)]|nr:filamentous hemagglutinin N-terminal domain-containing protein [Paracoccus sp. (in: a-proteobacteria)]